MKLSPKEFATKYAGKKVVCVKFNAGVKARIVGFTDISVVIEPIDYIGRKGKFTAVVKDFDHCNILARRNYYTTIKLINIQKLPIAYPHKCKLCHSPSRNGKVVQCSNIRCKSRLLFKKMIVEYIKANPIKEGFDIDHPIKVLCQKCNTVSRIYDGISAYCNGAGHCGRHTYTYKPNIYYLDYSATYKERVYITRLGSDGGIQFMQKSRARTSR